MTEAEKDAYISYLEDRLYRVQWPSLERQVSEMVESQVRSIMEAAAVDGLDVNLDTIRTMRHTKQILGA